MTWREKNWKTKATTISLIFIGSLILFSSLGRFHWSADVFATFLDYLLLIFIVLLGVQIWQKAWRTVLISLLVLSWGLIDLFTFSAASLYPETTADFRLMVFNIYYENSEVDAMYDLIRQHDPDIIYLMEYPSNANPIMRLDLNETYPYQLIEPSRFTMGTAIYSKHPFDQAEIHQFAGTRIPITEVTINADGHLFTFVGGHPWPPMPPWGQLHREQLEDIIDVAAAVDQAQTPLIVAGDFNTAPQTYMLRNMSQQANVQQVRQRFDLTKTYTVTPLISIPLDHIFVSEAIHASDYFYGDPAGSDHKPIFIDFSIQP